MTQKNFNSLSWLVVTGSIALVTIAWGNNVSWNITSLSAYQWFPLLGLIAWVTMAEHYYLGTIRILNPELKKPKYFKEITGAIVLASLILHPGILAYAQNKNGQGLPPNSFVNYVGEGLKLAVFLGTISLLIFLSFEFFDRMKNNAFIKKHWIWVSISQSIAMTLIWVHAMRLGGVTGEGWFKFVWIFYGFSLIPCFYIIHKLDFTQKAS